MSTASKSVGKVSLEKLEGAATYFILLLCVGNHLVFSFMAPHSVFFYGFFNSKPLWLGGLSWITSQLVHQDLAHLFWNMAVFFICALPLENRFGSKKVLGLFFLGGFACHIPSLFYHGRSVVAIGASGGVSAILIAYLLYFPRFEFFPHLSYRKPGTEEGLASSWLLFYYVGNNFLGMLIDFQHHLRVNFTGHLAGALVGAVAWCLWGETQKAQMIHRSSKEFRHFNTAQLLAVTIAIIAAMRFSPFIINDVYMKTTTYEASKSPQVFQFKMVHWAIANRRKKEMKMVINGLYSPPELRHIGVQHIRNASDVEDLAEKLGFSKTDPNFQDFVTLYREAPWINNEYRGYRNPASDF